MSIPLNKYFQNGGGYRMDTPQPTNAVYNTIFADEIGAPITPINWREFLPIPEVQKAIPFCVSFSRLNAGEAVARRNELELNLSDRYLGVISGTSKSGNSLETVSDAFRNKGTVKEEECQWKEEWLLNPYTYWKDIFNLADVPQGARRYYAGNYSWVWGREARRNALAYSPIQIAIGVGNNYDGGIIKDPLIYTCYHAILLYWQDEAGNMYIFDSVEPFLKVLDKNYKIFYALAFRDLPDGWREINKPMNKLVKKKDKDEIFLELDERIWVKEMEDVEKLQKAGIVSEIQVVDIFTTPYNGKIFGTANFADLLKILFGKVQ